MADGQLAYSHIQSHGGALIFERPVPAALQAYRNTYGRLLFRKKRLYARVSLSLDLSSFDDDDGSVAQGLAAISPLPPLPTYFKANPLAATFSVTVVGAKISCSGWCLSEDAMQCHFGEPNLNLMTYISRWNNQYGEFTRFDGNNGLLRGLVVRKGGMEVLRLNIFHDPEGTASGQSATFEIYGYDLRMNGSNGSTDDRKIGTFSYTVVDHFNPTWSGDLITS